MPYRVEYAKTARSGCTGPKPCAGTKIGKGEVRFGSWVEFMGNGSFKWRHWGCVTSKIINNIKTEFGDDPNELDGYEDLNDEDKDRIKKAFNLGYIPQEDVPSTQEPEMENDEEGNVVPRKTGGHGGSPKKDFKAKKHEQEAKTGDDVKEKQTKSKKRAKKTDDNNDDDNNNMDDFIVDDDDDDDAIKPKSKKGRKSSSESKTAKAKASKEAGLKKREEVKARVLAHAANKDL